MKFNRAKCKVMHFGHANGRSKYIMKDNEIEVSVESTSEEKDFNQSINQSIFVYYRYDSTHTSEYTTSEYTTIYQ